ncbi:histidine phosphatase family protein [Candidatus Uhrbacteria bacterium]|nr:MAG: histidine phosphatase family protein [Candidatus Uhrbacteria bacterium]
MKTIYLVRHGHVDNPNDIFYDEDVPLSDAGAREAFGLAEDLKRAGCAPARIVASPYLRARETAHIISTALDGPEVEYDDRLVEWQVGDWFGKPLSDFRTFAGYDRRPFVPHTDGIESFPEMAARVRASALDLVARVPPGGCGIVVSHREPMAAAILSLQDKGWEEIPLLDLPKGSLWKLDFSDDGAFVSSIKYLDRASPESKNTV